MGAAILALCRHAMGTAFLNHDQLLSGVNDAAWFKDNIPFLELPDQQIQDVYYYRWQTHKEHLVYTGAQYGYMASEFLDPVFYGAPYGGIVAAAGHHINEGRWIRDQKFGKDVVNYWLSGPGQFAKEASDAYNSDTTDWAHEYSFWAASSVWRQYLVTGDQDFAVGQLDNLVKQYLGWDNHFNSDLGLYWQAPVWDATEYTAASYESGDAYHGGHGYRPTINAYQYGDARAIAAIAALSGDSALASEYESRATALQTNMQSHLWDSDLQFFMHRARDNNPSGALLTTREIMGYIPWMFNMSQASNSAAFAQLKDSQGFAATFGPTTAERRSSWYMYHSEKCCEWDGPSWPFATSQTLTAVENLLHDYPAQSYITSADYVALLQGYAATQYKDGVPYVAEAHHPDDNSWLYDTASRSEDYNHSTFIDNVIAGLLGLRAQSGNSLVVNPLVPSSWEYFVLENVGYHGHEVTILWDSTGSRYGQGKGLKVYVDGNLAASSDSLSSLAVDVGSVISQDTDTKVNIAANGQQFPLGPTPFVSYNFSSGGANPDDMWNAIDGIVWRVGIPQNTRWTSYASSSSEDYFGVDFHRDQAVSDVRLYFYDDAGGVQVPTSFDLQYYSGSDWVTVPDQTRSDITANGETKITFPALVTSRLRVVAPNHGSGIGWGLSEFEVWTEAIFQLRNVNSGKLMGVDHESLVNSANIQQYEDNGSRDHLWQFVRVAGGWLKIKNVNSGLLLGVENMSTANSAQLQQYEDSGTDDHLWRVELRCDDYSSHCDTYSGNFVIVNKNSGKLAGVDNMSTENSANVVQFEDNATMDHMWNILPAVPLS